MCVSREKVAASPEPKRRHERSAENGPATGNAKTLYEAVVESATLRSAAPASSLVIDKRGAAAQARITDCRRKLLRSTNLSAQRVVGLLVLLKLADIVIDTAPEDRALKDARERGVERPVKLRVRTLFILPGRREESAQEVTREIETRDGQSAAWPRRAVFGFEKLCPRRNLRLNRSGSSALSREIQIERSPKAQTFCHAEARQGTKLTPHFEPKGRIGL